MSLVDDLITAGLGAVLAGTAAIWGARIGANATRAASLDAFQQGVDREQASWRAALHYECLLNIQQHKTRDKPLRPVHTAVLDDCFAHAAAFTRPVLQRIVWALGHHQDLHALLARGATGADDDPEREAVRYSYSGLIAEIEEIEKALRDQVEP